jgi:hypothetical protein
MTQFLVIGSGRWALHLQKSLALAGVRHHQWARRLHSEADLFEKLKSSTHVWLAISDSALPEWSQRLKDFRGLLLHSSGALEIPGVHSVHPLMSFAPELYPDDFYDRYAFVTTSPLSREELIPSLKNPFIRIPVEKKAFYHAMCVLAGNGSALLWRKFFSEMRNLGLSEATTRLYAERITRNLLSHPGSALTGPLVRNDKLTLQKDLESMQGDPYQPVLAALIEAYAAGERR